MPATLDLSGPPFDTLTDAERRKLAAAADVAFLLPGKVLFNQGDTPTHLYVILKGLVSEKVGDAVVTVRGEGDLVGADALAAPASATAEVRQEAIVQMLPRRMLLELGQTNPGFEAWFNQRLGERLAARADREAARGMSPLMMAKVGDAPLRPPEIVPGTMTIKEAALRMHQLKVTALLTGCEDGATGILTDRDLAKAALVYNLPPGTRVDQVASYPALTVDYDAFLFRAQLMMTRHGVRHMGAARAIRWPCQTLPVAESLPPEPFAAWAYGGNRRFRGRNDMDWRANPLYGSVFRRKEISVSLAVPA